MDTHAVIWFLGDDPEMSSRARIQVEDAISKGCPVFISAITVVEVVYLVEKNRIPKDALWEMKRALLDPRVGIALIPVDFKTTETLESISRTLIPDMPDRIIAATSLAYNLTLVTRDSRLRNSPIRTLW